MLYFSKKEEPAKKKKRSFDAAKYNRLLASWLAVSRSINDDIEEGVDAIRGRARGLAQNEPMVKKYLALVAANVVGSTGIKLQARVSENDKQDKLANDAIEAAWLEFGKAGICDITGRMSMNDMLRTIIQCVARDGEALIYEHSGVDNGFGYALQLLDINRLDTRLSRPPSNGNNAIIMGVEIDGNGKSVAYHLKNNRFGKDEVASNPVRYSADNLIHLFLPDSPEQVRGYSWLHASMVRIQHLKKYQEFALVASAVGASKMGFFTQPEGDGTGLADEEDEETGELFQEAAAGQFGILPEGVNFTPFNPDYPHAMYDTFVKAAKRDISSGINVSYHSLANDLEGVNFSSIRSGTLEEREQWKVYQDWFISCFVERIYNKWLRSALLSEAIKSVTGQPLPAAKRDKFMAHEFLGRRWPWVDPLKDEQANTEALRNSLASPYKIAAQKGEDIEDILNDLERFEQEKKARGLSVDAKSIDNSMTR